VRVYTASLNAKGTAPAILEQLPGGKVLKHKRPKYTAADVIFTVQWLNERERIHDAMRNPANAKGVRSRPRKGARLPGRSVIRVRAGTFG
jgi:hypothetical protein